MDDNDEKRPEPLKGAIAGLAAGLAGSLAMDAFQNAARQLSGDRGGGESSTEKAADKIAEAATGAPLAPEHKAAGGEAVHYGIGAVLGIGYGIAAEYRPSLAAGFGSAFGVTEALLLDETAVPLAGLSPPPWRTPASSHLYALASHVVFGLSAEAARRLARAALDAGSSHRSKAMPKETPKQKRIVERVMHEFKEGELKSGSGRKVKNPKQAIAIGLSEAGASNQKSPARNRESLKRTESRGGADAGESKAALYEEAKKRNIPGRSKMGKAELERALGR